MPLAFWDGDISLGMHANILKVLAVECLQKNSVVAIMLHLKNNTIENFLPLIAVTPVGWFLNGEVLLSSGFLWQAKQTYPFTQLRAFAKMYTVHITTYKYEHYTTKAQCPANAT